MNPPDADGVQSEDGRLNSLHSYQVLDSAPEQAFDELAALAGKLLSSPMALVGLLAKERQWFKARCGVELNEIPLEDSFCRHLLTHSTRFSVRDALLDSRFAHLPQVQGGPKVRAYAGVPLVNGDGHLLGSLCVMDRQPRDWTELELDLLQQLAQQVMTLLELRRRQQQLRQMASLVPAAIYQFRVGPQGQTSFPFASQAFADIFGLDPTVLQQDSSAFMAAIHPEDRDLMRHSVAASRQSMQAWSLEFRCQLPDGRCEWFLGQSRPLQEPGGAVLWHGFFINVSDRRRAEQDLREAEMRWKFALEGSAVGVWDWDIERQQCYFSPQYRALYGFSGADVLRDPEGPERVHPDDQGAVALALQQHVQGLSPSYRSEYRSRCRDGEWKWTLSRGLVVARNAAGEPTRMIGTHTDITERKHADEDNYRRAYFDALTGLPNRAQLLLKLSEWLQTRPAPLSGALFHVDLDGFKRLNHARGHSTGDTLLSSVAQRLAECLPVGAFLARLAADEFVVLLPSLAAPGHVSTQVVASLVPLQQALAMADQLRVSLLQPLPLGEHSFSITASLGVTVFPTPGTEADAEGLLREADAAMNHAKATGANRVAAFEPGMQTEIEKLFLIEEDLKSALAQGQLSVHVQPQFNKAQAVIGAELLMRWTHPERGPVSPVDFIPVAETSGLIVPLGEWVLEQAAQALLRLQRAGWDIPLSVNVSPRQFRQLDFVDRVRALLQRTGAPAERLIFEITEGLLVERSDSVLVQMNELIDLGIRFSIDDFGTGFSSLGYLKRLPIHEIKIDRSFINGIPDDEGDAAIVRSVLLMARQFRLKVIAEGVEDQQQVDFLFANGCEGLQGFLFSRPQPLDHWLAQAAADPR